MGRRVRADLDATVAQRLHLCGRQHQVARRHGSRTTEDLGGQRPTFRRRAVLELRDEPAYGRAPGEDIGQFQHPEPEVGQVQALAEPRASPR